MSLTLPCEDKSTGANFNNSFTYVDLTQQYCERNQMCYFYSSDFSNEYINKPTLLENESHVMGFREVFVRTSVHALVKVTEMYPVYGRQHFNFYNNGTWKGWTSITPS